MQECQHHALSVQQVRSILCCLAVVPHPARLGHLLRRMARHLIMYTGIYSQGEGLSWERMTEGRTPAVIDRKLIPDLLPSLLIGLYMRCD